MEEQSLSSANIHERSNTQNKQQFIEQSLAMGFLDIQDDSTRPEEVPNTQLIGSSVVDLPSLDDVLGMTIDHDPPSLDDIFRDLDVGMEFDQEQQASTSTTKKTKKIPSKTKKAKKIPSKTKKMKKVYDTWTNKEHM